MFQKIKEWVLRYGPAEIISTIFAVTISYITYNTTENAIMTAFAGVWGENIGFYGCLFFRDYNKSFQDQQISLIRKVYINSRNLFVEFGVAEIADSFLIRPFCMYYFITSVESTAYAIISGKLVADIFFYIPAIIGYEVKKKWFQI
jgi:hypothetical protein